MPTPNIPYYADVLHTTQTNPDGTATTTTQVLQQETTDIGLDDVFYDPDAGAFKMKKTTKAPEAKPLVVPSWYRSDEAQHWYSAVTSMPAEDQATSSGKTTKFTLKHARKMLEEGRDVYVPSVTNVLSILGNFGIEEWARSEAIKLALSMQGSTQEKVETEFDKWRSQWADRGSYLHSLMYKKIAEGVCADRNNCICHITGRLADEGFSPQSAERPFIDKLNMFGGKTDAILAKDGKSHVFDWKFTRKKRPFYEKELIQISAYTIGNGAASGTLVQIDQDTRQEVDRVTVTIEEAESYFKVFLAIKEAWHEVKKYRPKPFHVQNVASEEACKSFVKRLYDNRHIFLKGAVVDDMLNNELRKLVRTVAQ